MRIHPDQKRSFTLIEVIIALTVLAIGLVSIFSLFAGSLYFTRVANNYIQVAILGSNALDEVKTFGYNNLPASDTIKNLAVNYPGRITDFPAPFTGAVSITAVNEDIDVDGNPDYQDKNGNTTLKEIVITVSYPGKTGTQSETFKTRLCK